MILERSYAKLNLTLDVTGLLPGGYHSVRGVMQSTDFGDELTIEPGAGEWRAESNLKYLPTGGANLAVRAALLFREATGKGPEGGTIKINKRIPVCGGLAGGSGNAAAVLRAMNREFEGGLSEEELRKLGEQLGSDIPFCISGGTMLAEGRGEILSPLPSLPDCGIVICRPNFASSTPELFAAVDKLKVRMRPDTDGMIAALEAKDLEGVARRMFNIFEAALPRRQASMVAET
ncbi:MAG: 4-(cytidine 5'-diphospho)-2-C-methyl-D-erythritol kinase, partial [Oscillospiraceae bacterium]|nr:4-(cytidine 5'-diphospho)-2-C-methyl-D-erythritol kinase [Oscillospiraceae bacterium]